MDETLSPLAQARFQGALHSTFEVRHGDDGHESLTMQLVEVAVRPAPPGYEQFSALFIGPATPVMPQGTYRFVHARLGEIDLFMVPVGSVSAGIQYEVCISREIRDGAPKSG